MKKLLILSLFMFVFCGCKATSSDTDFLLDAFNPGAQDGKSFFKKIKSRLRDRYISSVCESKQKGDENYSLRINGKYYKTMTLYYTLVEKTNSSEESYDVREYAFEDNNTVEIRTLVNGQTVHKFLLSNRLLKSYYSVDNDVHHRLGTLCSEYDLSYNSFQSYYNLEATQPSSDTFTIVAINDSDSGNRKYIFKTEFTTATLKSKPDFSKGNTNNVLDNFTYPDTLSAWTSTQGELRNFTVKQHYEYSETQQEYTLRMTAYQFNRNVEKDNPR